MKNIKSHYKWMKRGMVIAIIGVLVGVGYMYTTKEETTIEASTVQEYLLNKQAISETLTTSGVVTSETTEQLLGDVSSEVTNIYVAIGDQVSAGEVLAEMNPIDVQSSILNQEVIIANLEQEMKTLGNDKGQSKKLAYENTKVALENTTSTHESNKTLYKNGAISQSDLDQSTESYNKALSDYNSAKIAFNSYDYATEYSILEKRLQVENTKLESLRQDLLDHQVVASTHGVVTALNIEEGEVPKESDVMIEIQDLSNLKIEASISEYEINQIAVGQEVIVTTLGNEDKAYSGLIERIYPSGEIEGSEVYVTVIVDVQDEDSHLKPNFSANLEILVAQKSDAFLVPYDALVKTPRGYAIQIKTEDDEKPNMIRVETGIESDLTIEVISDQLVEDMVVLVESTVDLGSMQQRGGLMLPGMGGQGRPGGGPGGQGGGKAPKKQ